MSVVQDPSNEHPKKKQHLTSLDNDNMTCVQHEIADIKESLKEIGLALRLEFADIRESLEEMASEAREDREDHQHIINTLEDLDFARNEVMTYDAQEERDNIYYMLKALAIQPASTSTLLWLIKKDMNLTQGCSKMFSGFKLTHAGGRQIPPRSLH